MTENRPGILLVQGEARDRSQPQTRDKLDAIIVLGIRFFPAVIPSTRANDNAKIFALVADIDQLNGFP